MDEIMPLTAWQGDGVPDVTNRAFDPATELKNLQDNMVTAGEQNVDLANRKIDVMERAVMLDEMKTAGDIPAEVKFDTQLRAIALSEAVKANFVDEVSTVSTAETFLAFLKGE